MTIRINFTCDKCHTSESETHFEGKYSWRDELPSGWEFTCEDRERLLCECCYRKLSDAEVSK